MRFDTPAGENASDRMTVIGKPVRRIDGPLKTTGTAPYAYERHDVAQGQLVGYPLGAGIAKGRIVSMDTSEAKAAPGVIGIVTTLEMDRLPKDKWNIAYLFGGDEIQHYHQAIAVVVAESFEQARAAAALIRVGYQDDRGEFDLAAAREAQMDGEVEPMDDIGDFEGAFAAAPVTLDATYTTPGQCHAQMEPHATIAQWDGDHLTIWTSNQMIEWSRQALSTTFGLPADNFRLDSPYIGGGFGVKLFLRADAILAALAARRVGRPVKVALPRPMIANNTTHRGQTIQRIRIGADEDGRITAIAHDNASNTLPGGRGENGARPTQHFYAGANRFLVHRPVVMHLPGATRCGRLARRRG